MAVVVRIPTPLRALTKGNAEVQAKADTVDGVVEDLERQCLAVREERTHKCLGDCESDG